ncbi:MAG: hypothetical protein QXT14_02925 [Candidatus Bathyarchaeia archaeon]
MRKRALIGVALAVVGIVVAVGAAIACPVKQISVPVGIAIAIAGTIIARRK